MPRKVVKSPEDQKYDQIAKYLFKGTVAQVRKKFRSHIFQEWLTANPEIVKTVFAPPESSKLEIIEIIANIIIEREKISLKELTSLLKSKTTIKTQKQVKPLLKKLKFPPNINFKLPRKLIGSTILKIKKEQIPFDQFLFYLRQAYNAAPSKMGDMIEIPILANSLSKATGWSINHIYDQIYQAYLEKKVDLQPGKVTEGKTLVAEDGSQFYWFQFR